MIIQNAGLGSVSSKKAELFSEVLFVKILIFEWFRNAPRDPRYFLMIEGSPLRATSSVLLCDDGPGKYEGVSAESLPL